MLSTLIARCCLALQYIPYVAAKYNAVSIHLIHYALCMLCVPCSKILFVTHLEVQDYLLHCIIIYLCSPACWYIIRFVLNGFFNDFVQQIRAKLHELRKTIKIDHPSVVLVFMSHGNERGIYGIDSEIVEVEEIKEMFSGKNCPQLAGKPKIMIFQACRGGK